MIRLAPLSSGLIILALTHLCAPILSLPTPLVPFVHNENTTVAPHAHENRTQVVNERYLTDIRDYIEEDGEYEQFLNHLKREHEERVALNPANYAADDLSIEEILSLIEDRTTRQSVASDGDTTAESLAEHTTISPRQSTTQWSTISAFPTTEASSIGQHSTERVVASTWVPVPTTEVPATRRYSTSPPNTRRYSTERIVSSTWVPAPTTVVPETRRYSTSPPDTRRYSTERIVSSTWVPIPTTTDAGLTRTSATRYSTEPSFSTTMASGTRRYSTVPTVSSTIDPPTAPNRVTTPATTRRPHTRSMTTETTAIQANQEREADHECPICLRTMRNTRVEVLQCNHEFHVDCFSTWVGYKGQHARCPICRGHIEDSRQRTHSP